MCVCRGVNGCWVFYLSCVLVNFYSAAFVIVI